MRRSSRNQRRSRAGRTPQLGVIGMIVIALAAVFAQTMAAQCIDHPDKRTAVRFNNESRFELTFFLDDDETGVVVPSRTVSNEIEVQPGEHLFRARAVVGGKSFFVWVINEVPEGQVCTWTVTDPQRDPALGDTVYRTAIGPSLKKLNAKNTPAAMKLF